MALAQLEGQVRVIGEGEAEHRAAGVGGGGAAAFEGLLGTGHQANFVEGEGFPGGFGQGEVRAVDGVEGAAEEANADLTEAREDLRQTMADARAWLESGNGQWVGNQTETMMLNALDAAQNLIDEAGITDPQTYRDAAATIEDIIDGVKQGTLW